VVNQVTWQKTVGTRKVEARNLTFRRKLKMEVMEEAEASRDSIRPKEMEA
jgi:hypothetical protein